MMLLKVKTVHSYKLNNPNHVTDNPIDVSSIIGYRYNSWWIELICKEKNGEIEYIPISTSVLKRYGCITIGYGNNSVDVYLDGVFDE